MERMMIHLVLSLLAACACAAPHTYAGVLGPSYHAPVLPVQSLQLDRPHGDLSYTATAARSPTGEVQQQTAVGKDALGGHTIRHSAQASSVDPHSGQSDFKHDEHEFHINPYLGQAAVHTSNAEASLNPTYGKAAFAQKRHQAKIAPGHASVSDVKDTAAVSSVGSAASRDVQAASTDVLHEGVARSAHNSHKSYSNVPGLEGESQAYEANHRSFDGHGYGNLHYDTQSARQAYDRLGHASASEAAYKLDHAYDARVNQGATNELEYSRHASHDPYGNYGAVTQTREASQGGQLVPVKPAVVVQEVTPVVYSHPTVVKTPAAYAKKAIVEAPVAYAHEAAVVRTPVAYSKETVVKAPVAYAYEAAVAEAPVAYAHEAAVVEAPVAYAHETVVKAPVAYKRPAAYKQPAPVVYAEPVAYKDLYDSHAYAAGYPNEGYYY